MNASGLKFQHKLLCKIVYPIPSNRSSRIIVQFEINFFILIFVLYIFTGKVVFGLTKSSQKKDNLSTTKRKKEKN